MTTMFDHTHRIALHPTQFTQLTELMGSGDLVSMVVAENGRTLISELRETIDGQMEQMSKADEQMAQEIRRTRLRKRRAFEDPDEERDTLDSLARSASQQTFIGVVLGILAGMQGALDSFETVLRDLAPKPLLVPKGFDSMDDWSLEGLRNLSMVMELNGKAMGAFVKAVEGIDELPNSVIYGAMQVAIAMDHYYQALLKRHTVEGVEIQSNPVTTDIAISVYENIDAHGEIAEGRKPDEISAYSMRKATVLADTVKSQAARQFIAEPDDFINVVIEHAHSRGVKVEMLCSLATVGSAWHTLCPNVADEWDEILHLWDAWTRLLPGIDIAGIFPGDPGACSRNGCTAETFIDRACDVAHHVKRNLPEAEVELHTWGPPFFGWGILRGPAGWRGECSAPSGLPPLSTRT